MLRRVRATIRAKTSPRIRLEDTPAAVVSLSSHSARLRILEDSLRGLLRLDYPRFTVELCVSESPPSSVVALTGKDRRLNIHVVQKDYGPATKFLYTLQRYPEHLIAVCDDDQEYSPLWLRKLIHWQQRLGNEICVAFTGPLRMGDGNLEAPGVRETLLPMGGVTPEGQTIYKKVCGETLGEHPVSILWPQGYAGYLLPAGLARRLDPFQHYQECLDSLPPDQRQDMHGRPNDDIVMGSYLHRLGIARVVVPRRFSQRTIERIASLQSITSLQIAFRERHAMTMSMATYLALERKGWL
jgi:hypothetical protein